jgi:ubiquinone/menaquinone biosynthesis C-methylase UbiE
LGVDISSKMLDSARAQARTQQVDDRVEFATMDALLLLEFPKNSFDLVNHRFAMSWLRTWDWPKLLSEYKRVSKPRGVIRITEASFIVESSSPALNHLNQMCLEAFHQAGHLFTLDKTGLTSQLAHLLRQHGLENVQTRTHTLEYRAGTARGQRFAGDVKLAYRTMVPFLRKWIRVPEDYETIYQQALADMQQADFVAPCILLTAWGNSPRKKEQSVLMEG